jgi:SH3 domain protein
MYKLFALAAFNFEKKEISMKLLSCFVTGLLLIASVVSAKTIYINDIVTVTLRTGPGMDHKIISMIKSGQKLEELESGEEWVRVRLPDGKEGWVFKRVLSQKEPNRVKFEKMKNDYQALLLKTGPSLEEFETLESENFKLVFELTENENLIKTLQDSYDNIKKESDELFKKKDKYTQAEGMIAELNKKNEVLEDEVLKFQKQQIFRWFFSGSGVLLVGFFLGFNARPQRRRSGLL